MGFIKQSSLNKDHLGSLNDVHKMGFFNRKK